MASPAHQEGEEQKVNPEEELEEEEEGEFIEEEEDDESDDTPLIAPNYVEIFDQHTNSVFCVDTFLDEKSRTLLVATGSGDETVFLLKMNLNSALTETPKLNFEVLAHFDNFHKETVTKLAFNSTGKLLATADCSGAVAIWDVPAKKLLNSFTNQLDSEEIMWLEWHPEGDLLCCGTKANSAYLLNGKLGKVLNGYYSHTNECTVGGFFVTNDIKQIITGGADGRFKQWNPKSNEPLNSINLSEALHAKNFQTGGSGAKSKVSSKDQQYTEDPIISMSKNESKNLVALGTETGHIFLVNVEKQRVVAAFKGKIPENAASGEEGKEAVETVDFAPSQKEEKQKFYERFVASGDASGIVCIWDTTNQTCRNTFQFTDDLVNEFLHIEPKPKEEKKEIKEEKPKEEEIKPKEEESAPKGKEKAKKKKKQDFEVEYEDEDMKKEAEDTKVEQEDDDYEDEDEEGEGFEGEIMDDAEGEGSSTRVVTKVQFSENGEFVFCSYDSGEIVKFDIKNGKIQNMFLGHKDIVLDFKVVSLPSYLSATFAKRLVLSVSDDKRLLVYVDPDDEYGAPTVVQPPKQQ